MNQNIHTYFAVNLETIFKAVIFSIEEIAVRSKLWPTVACIVAEFLPSAKILSLQ